MGREIEKKFIIGKPSAFPIGTAASRIEQYFLTPAGDYDTRRIRTRTTDGKTVYTYTEKRLLHGFTREENEREISESEFNALKNEIDPAIGGLVKTRYVYPYRGHSIETDVFPFWEEYAILEVELESEDESFELPDNVKIIADVTADKRFTNKSLARRVPAPEEFLRRT